MVIIRLLLHAFIVFILEFFTLLISGFVYAWGMGTNLQLGTGEEDDEWSPVKMTGKQLEDREVLMASSGGQHTVLLVKDKQESWWPSQAGWWGVFWPCSTWGLVQVLSFKYAVNLYLTGCAEPRPGGSRVQVWNLFMKNYFLNWGRSLLDHEKDKFLIIIFFLMFYFIICMTVWLNLVFWMWLRVHLKHKKVDSER